MEFSTGWWGTDLGRYRACTGTYQDYSYDNLPQLPAERFNGTFGWLLPQEAGPAADYMTPAVASAERLTAVGRRLADAGLALPSAFATFMASETLQRAVPSCTSCSWELSRTAVPSPFEDGAFLVRFLCDQQGCGYWYLYLAPGQPDRVVCSGILHDPDDGEEADEVGLAEMLEDTLQVAPGFEVFVYRFWVENAAWFQVVDQGRAWEELSEPVRGYLDHYRAGHSLVG